MILHYCTHYRSAYIYTYVGGSRNISPHIIISYHIVYDYIKLIWESHSNSRHMQKPTTNTRPNQSSRSFFFFIIANGGTNLWQWIHRSRCPSTSNTHEWLTHQSSHKHTAEIYIAFTPHIGRERVYVVGRESAISYTGKHPPTPPKLRYATYTLIKSACIHDQMDITLKHWVCACIRKFFFFLWQVYITVGLLACDARVQPLLLFFFFFLEPS